MARRERISMAEIARRKQAQRDADRRALASGGKTRDDLRRENSLVAPFPEIRVRLGDAKPLR
jgi:hypothetical protein